MEEVAIKTPYKDHTTNVVLDTVAQGRQCLVFVSSKASAEKVATIIASKIKDVKDDALAEEALNVLSSPTVQCEKLSACMRKRIAFHHAGLAPGQKTLIEDKFRDTTIRVIVCTPTLAAGVDLPAYRTIIRDLKRFTGGWGMQFIPVLEYQQMAGRAGRPGKETHGESIIVAQYASDAEVFKERFIDGDVEPIHSKLAVEPVLRMYTLSLIASQMITNYDDLLNFFDKTFYAHQFGDKAYIASIIQRVLGQLRTWKMLEVPDSDFMDADAHDDQKLIATTLGRRVSELYLDPLSAHQFVQGLHRIEDKVQSTIPLLHLVCQSLQARPLFSVHQKEIETIMSGVSDLLTDMPTIHDPSYKEYLDAIKTAKVLEAWTCEVPEQQLMERFNVRPGELKAKIDAIVWLLSSLREVARVLQMHTLLTPLEKLRIQVEFGIRAELLQLIDVKDIGRVRSRKLFDAGVKSKKDLVDITYERLAAILGPVVARNVKDFVGNNVTNNQNQEL